MDAYMADFSGYMAGIPNPSAPWVLDSVTLGYAAERVWHSGGRHCRTRWELMAPLLGVASQWNQISLSRKMNCSSPDPEKQIPAPMFWASGTDPIYNFEQNVREGLRGVKGLWSHPGSRAGTQKDFLVFSLPV